MNKLKVVIAMIIMPFLYSIGCETISTYPGGMDAYLAHVEQYEQLSNYYFNLSQEAIDMGKASLTQELEALPTRLWPGLEAEAENVVFMTANTVMLAGIIMPILLQIPADNWDARCALAYQTQGTNTTRGFVLNKKSASYNTEHALIVEGRLKLEKGKFVIKNSKIYKIYDDGDIAQTPTLHHDKFWLAVHKKDSDWVNFLPIPKYQEQKLIAEIRRINGAEANNEEIESCDSNDLNAFSLQYRM